jgi:sulfatase modifying factor 1
MTISNPEQPRDADDAMVAIAGGSFRMGSDHFYPEEAPTRRVTVDAFWIDATPVTNAQFARFVEATGHVTTAELAPDAKDYPGMPPEFEQPGSLVFQPPKGFVQPLDPQHWWELSFGADWRHPTGPDSSIDTLMDHPVVQVSHGDALAYAKWAGKSLPTEAEFEFAAHGGLEDADYAWGDELAPGGAMLANYWQGRFPSENSMEDGWAGTSPVRSYPPNGYGIFDMIGNVWEWTNDWWALPRPIKKPRGACCTISNPRGGLRSDSFDPDLSDHFPRKVLKGGSHLCAENYCQRYRPAARHPETIDTSTSHIGFRCVRRRR